MPTLSFVPRAVALVLTAALLASACGESTDGGGGGGGGDGADYLPTAQAATEAAMAGTSREVDATSRPAVADKKLAIIASAKAVISSQIPSEGALAAATAIGWDATIYDGQNNPALWPGLVRQAIAADMDGIILVAIDCQTVKQPLEEAKAAGIAITGIYAFDCNDPKAGDQPEGLFSSVINLGVEAADVGDFTKQYGADQANYIIAESGNQAKILAINAPEFTVLNYTYEGFKETVEASGGSEIVSTLEITASDITGGTLLPKIQAELLRFPQATWVKSPFTYVTTLGIAPALGARAGDLKVMGGEGFEDELTLIREGKVTAVNVIASDWFGWAAVDTLNSQWRDEDPADSGIGWTLVDKDNKLPPSGPFVPSVDFKATYLKAWGVA